MGLPTSPTYYRICTTPFPFALLHIEISNICLGWTSHKTPPQTLISNLTTTKITPLLPKIEHPLPITISMVPFSFQNSPSPSPHHPLFASKSHFHKRLEKNGKVWFKVFEEPSRRRPLICHGSTMVHFNPIAIHVGVNNLLLTLWHYIMPK